MTCPHQSGVCMECDGADQLLQHVSATPWVVEQVSRGRWQVVRYQARTFGNVRIASCTPDGWKRLWHNAAAAAAYAKAANEVSNGRPG